MVQLVDKLDESFEKYNSAINAVISKYDDVQTLRDKVEKLSTREGLTVRLKKEITTDIDMEKYILGREVLAKLRSIGGGKASYFSHAI